MWTQTLEAEIWLSFMMARQVARRFIHSSISHRERYIVTVSSYNIQALVFAWLRRRSHLYYLLEMNLSWPIRHVVPNNKVCLPCFGLHRLSRKLFRHCRQLAATSVCLRFGADCLFKAKNQNLWAEFKDAWKLRDAELNRRVGCLLLRAATCPILIDNEPLLL